MSDELIYHDEVAPFTAEQFDRMRYRADRFTRVFDRWTDIVSKITYKPRYSLRLDSAYGMIQLIVSVATVDTHNPERKIYVEHRRRITDDWNPDTEKDERLLNEIRNVLHSVERHEADEWIRFDGVMVFDPHTR